MLPRTLRRSFLARQPFASRYQCASTPAPATRQFQTSTQRQYPRKDDQDKDSINVESNEYSKSGGDKEAAGATDKAAFDPQQTSPEAEHETARQESGGNSSNPLNVSPANHEISQTNSDKQRGDPQGSEGETGSGGSRQRTSGVGSPQKSGGGKSGGSGSGV